MKKQTKAEIEERSKSLDLENHALRIYASALRDAEPCAAMHINDGSSRDYIEIWSLYRPLAASGGVVAVECRDNDDKTLSWNVMLLTEATRRFSDAACPYRRQAVHAMYAAHVNAVTADSSPLLA